MAKVYKPKYVKRILINQAEVEKGIKKAANWINKNYAHAKKPPVILAILKGAVPFYGRLVMDLKIECVFEFMLLSSFRGNMKAVADPKIVADLIHEIKGRDLIIVEDVLDTARTMSVLVKYLKAKNAKSIKTMVLVDKPDQRVVKFKVDYKCFTLKGNPFLIGYGLDIKELARNLPYIGEFDKNYLDKI